MRSRIICGLVGPVCSLSARKHWNALFQEQGSDAFFDFYRTMNQKDLELRLSEMFVLERRGYLIAEQFQESIVPLLDRLDASATKKGRVDTIVNERGALVGYSLENDSERMAVWFQSTLLHG